MAGNYRIPPAVNEVFVQIASQVCERARMDYDEWLVNSQELAFHLQERWREGIQDGLSTEAAQERALKLFGDLGQVARSLRKPWLQRLLHYKRFQPQRYGFFILAFFFYTWFAVVDTHWRKLLEDDVYAPYYFLLPIDGSFWTDGVGAMFVGFAAALCVVVDKWRPHLKFGWVNRLLVVKSVLLAVAGYALFLLVVRFSYLAAVNLPDAFDEFGAYTKIFIPVCFAHLMGIALGWLGAVCLLYEIWGRRWTQLRLNTVFAGFLLGWFVCFGLGGRPGHDSTAPIVHDTLNFNAVDDTQNGHLVRKWMEQKCWLSTQDQHLKGQHQNGRYVYQTCESPSTDDYYDLVYVYADGTWKFDDVQIETIHGLEFDWYLSVIVKNLTMAQGQFSLQNGGLSGADRKILNQIFDAKPFTKPAP